MADTRGQAGAGLRWLPAGPHKEGPHERRAGPRAVPLGSAAVEADETAQPGTPADPGTAVEPGTPAGADSGTTAGAGPGPDGTPAQAAPGTPPDPAAAHDSRERHVVKGLRSAERLGGVAGARAASALGSAGKRAAGAVGTAAEALHLEVVRTRFAGERALTGHVLGMRLLIPAHGMHGPRETAALLYLFRDALAIRPTDDAPMSAVPMYGLHMVLPHVALAHWMYKTGRTAHANLDLAREDRDVESEMAAWTVDEFKEATAKLEVHPIADIPAPVHLYEHMGLVRMALPVAGGPPVRLKSALPESTQAYVRTWELFDSLQWPGGLTMEVPGEANESRADETPAGETPAGETPSGGSPAGG